MPPEIEATINAIRILRDPRFLATERGYQGALYCAIRSELERMGLLTEHRILEMEYQKSARHRLSQRPDIVFHIPTEISGESVQKNNFAVWALKHSGSQIDAEDDFQKLEEMFEVLLYPVGIFVNIASRRTHLGHYTGQHKERIHAFAVPGMSRSKIIHSYFKNGELIDEQIQINGRG